MTISSFNRFWMLIALILLIIITASGIITWSRYEKSEPLEIILAPVPELAGEIYMCGAVNNPGIYPLLGKDTITGIIQSAGGMTGNNESSRLKLLVLPAGEAPAPQKIDINRAELWLLEALPGIGEGRAEAIIDYRRQNGPFRNVNELVKVTGIGTATYEQIKELITVTD